MLPRQDLIDITPSRIVASLLAGSLLLVPVLACAQRGGAAPPFDGPRGAFSFEMSDGEPVSFYLEFSRMLDLSEAQKTSLIEIRRKLRIANAPFMRQLDSLREAAGVNMESRGRIDARDQEALRRFREWSVAVTDSIRLNNDGARRDIRALLDATQLARADSLNREMQDARGRRPQGRPRPRAGGASRLDAVRLDAVRLDSVRLDVERRDAVRVGASRSG